MEIWEKALKHYKNITTHLLMTEDFAFSTVLFYYAKKQANNTAQQTKQQNLR